MSLEQRLATIRDILLKRPAPPSSEFENTIAVTRTLSAAAAATTTTTTTTVETVSNNKRQRQNNHDGENKIRAVDLLGITNYVKRTQNEIQQQQLVNKDSSSAIAVAGAAVTTVTTNSTTAAAHLSEETKTKTITATGSTIDDTTTTTTDNPTIRKDAATKNDSSSSSTTDTTTSSSPSSIAILAADRTVHDYAALYIQEQSDQIEKETRAIEEKRMETLRKISNVWKTYQYGLSQIANLKDLRDAPDAIMPNNFCDNNFGLESPKEKGEVDK